MRHEYYHTSVILDSLKGTRLNYVYCITGPRMFTATVREAILEQQVLQTTNYSMRFAGVDLHEFLAVFKVAKFRKYSKHGADHDQADYKTYIEEHKVNLLNEYTS